MSSNHARVHGIRAAVLGVIRLIALAMVVIGVLLVLNRLLYGVLGVGDVTAAFNIFVGIGETQGMYVGLPLIAVGCVLGWISRRLSHWVVRAPEIGCAGCGYETLGDDGQCSECGYR
ncbi:MAG: hypothetical protein KDA29_04100 [Phycisphaerales bacterium]|nr:hypothetical protein [Phycisphaerales bacterium]